MCKRFLIGNERILHTDVILAVTGATTGKEAVGWRREEEQVADWTLDEFEDTHSPSFAVRLVILLSRDLVACNSDLHRRHGRHGASHVIMKDRLLDACRFDDLFARLTGKHR